MFRPQRTYPLTKTPTWNGPKPKLPMKVLAIFRVNHHDLEEYLKLVYRMADYSIRAATGAKGGMTPEIDVSGVLPPMSNICQLVDNIRRGRRTRNLKLILDLLCQDEFIPAGRYIIDMVDIKSPIEMYAEVLSDTQDCLHPKCIQIKEQCKNDTGFLKQAKLLDENLLKHQEELVQIVSHTSGKESDND